MKEKRVFYSELAYFSGLAVLAVGTAFMEAADFGVSMVVAPAYLVYLRLSQMFAWFTFGMAEYVLQALVLVLLALVMKGFKRSYLFSFATALLYGLMLDTAMACMAFLPAAQGMMRPIYYALGMVLCSLGVAMLFHTYISPEAYELFVKEIADHKRLSVSKVKTAYDCVSCAAAVVMSFVFFGFGHFEGVKLGTIFCALVNGSLIGWISRMLTARFVFKDRLALRKYFTV